MSDSVPSPHPDLGRLHEAGVVLFDGECNFCNGTIRFILDRERDHRLHFASLQSDIGRKLVRSAGLSPEDLDTLIYLEGGRHHTKSSAVLRIARRLKGGWPILAAFIAVPKFLRDLAYSLFARHRYQLFGRAEACFVPAPEVRARFLD